MNGFMDMDKICHPYLQERSGQIPEESANAACMEEFWKFIWHLRVPNKIQNFTWRACRNILPTKANLFRRQVAQDNKCEACGNVEETTGHLLWHCHRAKEVWNEVGLVKDNTMDCCPEYLDLLWYG